MPVGLAIPVGVNNKGGALRTEGDANDAKIIKAALGSDDSENSFQQAIGIGIDMIFDINDPTSRPAIQARLVRVFAKLEAQRRYKLVEETLAWYKGEEEGELVMEFKYVSLEADEERTFRRQFSAAGDGARSGGN